MKKKVLILVFMLCLALSGKGQKPKFTVPLSIDKAWENKLMSSINVNNLTPDKTILTGTIPDYFSHWSNGLDDLLKKKIWEQSGWMYDYSEFLMVPLHVAFYFQIDSMLLDFKNQFVSFSLSHPEFDNDNDRLNRLNYMYLVSRYLVLTAQTNRRDLKIPGLYDIIREYIDFLWNDGSGNVWGGEKFSFPGMKQRLNYLIQDTNTTTFSNYYNSIQDFSIFLFGIDLDLATYERLNRIPLTSNDYEIIYCFDRVFHKFAVFQPDGGWLFQPGILKNYPDNKYSGLFNPIVDNKVSISTGNWDASHFMRFPLLLQSALDFFPVGSTFYKYYDSLRIGLIKQFFDHVISKKVNGLYYFNNYMDGTNGYYRAQNKNGILKGGFGPYQNCEHIFMGWWSFLNSSKISSFYNDIYTKFSDYDSTYLFFKNYSDRTKLLKDVTYFSIYNK